MSVNKVLVHTQYYENYGFNEGREAWKPKGSHIFYIEIDAELLMYTNPAEIFSKMLEAHNSESRSSSIVNTKSNGKSLLFWVRLRNTLTPIYLSYLALLIENKK